MTPAISGQGARAAQQYAESARQARMESVRAQTGLTPGETAKARVRTRSIGFRLGGFGLTYTSEDVQLEPTPSVRNSFKQSFETASLRREVVTSTASETLSRLPAQRRAGIRAYQDALSPASSEANRSLLAVA